MNRRNFLATLAGTLTLDPERLLWRPGVKLISIPKAAIPIERDLVGFSELYIKRIEPLRFHPQAFALIWPAIPKTLT